MNIVFPQLCLCLVVAALSGRAGTNDLVQLVTEHVDFRILYQPGEPNPLAIVLRDEDRRVNHAATNAILVVSEDARLEVPPGFEIFGEAGAPLWVLPQSQDPRLLSLGFSAEGIPFDVFGGPLTFSLRAVRGAGDFLAWQADALGGLLIKMNSRDGLSDADATQPIIGSHEHFNFGFTSNGVYELTFQVSGRRLGEATNLVSEPTIFTFHVLPLPVPLDTPFERWQARQWPGQTDRAIIGAEADPDGDGVVNLVEYALGMDPNVASLAGLPTGRVQAEGDNVLAILEFRHPISASDVEFTAWRTPTLAPAVWEPLPGPSTNLAVGELQHLFFVAGRVEPGRSAFLQLRTRRVSP